jgi:zinc/manganese transport system ATP-binding protein
MPLKISNLSAGYDRHPVVHHVTGAFTDGSMTAIIGPNGGGKSTLLKAMGGFMSLMGGEVDFDGLKKNEIAYLPQQFEIDRTFPINVLDVVMLGHWPRKGALGRYGKPERDAALWALGQVDMAGSADRPVISLSTGQWQRVLFARLSLQKAKLILLDEPFAAIDSRTTHDLIHMLEDWRKAGTTIVCVMHDFQSVREHFPQTLLIARDLIAWGDTPAVMTDQNLARASALAGKWVEPADICDIDGRRVA